MKQVMIVAGEASGDLHGGKLVTDVIKKNKDVRFFGIGGSDMRKAGVEILVESSELAVVGLIEVLVHRKAIFSALDKMKVILKQQPPDLLLLIDYPEFNLRLAKYAKSCGVKVLFYISPQVWAWRQKRVHKIKKVVDRMAVVFPFEAEFYKKYNVPVTYVGHPLTGEVCASKDKDQLIKDFHLDPKTKHVGLLPGSRKSEIKRLLPIILKSASKLAEEDKNIEFLLPIASTLSKNDFLPFLGQFAHLRIHLIENRPYDVMEASDAIVTVSGTVTLEIALIGTPMVIINKLSWITYLIVRRMIKIKFIGLCNIIANRQLVPELVQCMAKPVLIAKLLNKMLCNIDYANQLKENLENVKVILADDKNKKSISEVTLEMLD